MNQNARPPRLPRWTASGSDGYGSGDWNPGTARRRRSTATLRREIRCVRESAAVAECEPGRPAPCNLRVAEQSRPPHESPSTSAGGTWSSLVRLASDLRTLDVQISNHSPAMLETIAILLVLLWLVGIVSSYTLNGYIHLLLVMAFAAIVLHLVRGRDPLK